MKSCASRLIGAVVIMLSVCGCALAESGAEVAQLGEEEMLVSEQAAAEDARQSLIALYGWLTGVNADVRAGTLETSVDMSFSDILDNLDKGFMLYYETWKKDRGFLLDVIYGRVSEDFAGPLLAADVKVTQTLLEAAYVWRNERPRTAVDYLAGARYVDMDNDLTITLGPATGSASAGDSWVEPFVGARYRTALSDKWNFGLRGDIGGVVTGSDFTWQLSALFRYQMSRRWYVGLGYRYLDIDYDRGSFGFDGSMSGPIVGFAYGW